MFGIIKTEQKHLERVRWIVTHTHTNTHKFDINMVFVSVERRLKASNGPKIHFSDHCSHEMCCCKSSALPAKQGQDCLNPLNLFQIL